MVRVHSILTGQLYRSLSMESLVVSSRNLETERGMGVSPTYTACTWRQKPCRSAAEDSYMVSAPDGEGCEALASPHLKMVSPRFHIGTSLDSLPPGPEAWELVSSPLPPPALHLESREGRW
jgi:hypothetical protein